MVAVQQRQRQRISGSAGSGGAAVGHINRAPTAATTTAALPL
jgi:hypothetical protein